jgi:hypothetical protein
MEELFLAVLCNYGLPAPVDAQISVNLDVITLSEINLSLGSAIERFLFSVGGETASSHTYEIDSC